MVFLSLISVSFTTLSGGKFGFKGFLTGNWRFCFYNSVYFMFLKEENGSFGTQTVGIVAK